MKYYIYNPLAKNSININNNDLNTYFDCTNEQHMINLEKKLKNNDIITIIGGDGTLNYLINNYKFICDYNLEIFGNGSGNDFIRSLSKDSYYYTINDQYSFINTFGMGFDALVCENVNNAPKKNKLSYIIEAYRSIKNYKPFSLKITYNNQTYTYNKVWLCSLQNGSYFGGAINIAKHANVNDEQLDLCIAHNLSRFGVLLLLLFVKLGLVGYFKKYFFSVKTKDVYIYNGERRLIQLDGDVEYINQDIYLSKVEHLKIKKITKI